MTTPYVVGQWVRGPNFYGREELIRQILHGPRDCLWLLGTRRIGKTSVLKQVELLTDRQPELGYRSLFWDFQGAERPEDLHEGFRETLIDAGDRLEELEIPLDEVMDDDLFVSLRRVRQKLKARRLRLMLLCDEVEELITLNRNDPRLLRRLRRAMQSPEDVRTVLASKINLWELADERADTEPFLLGFTPPLFITGLDDDAADALIRQSKLPGESRPRLDEPTVDRVRRCCANHPFLMQLLCERLGTIGDLDRAIEDVAADQMVAFFFATDFEMLSETERQVIRIISERDASSSKSIQERLSADGPSVDGTLQRMEHLGYVQRDAGGEFVLANWFFKRWFCELSDSARSRRSPATSVGDTVSARTMVDESEPSVFSDRYELIERVGHGATGVVYKAMDRLLRAPLALKLLKPEYALHEEAIERLRREVLLSRDVHHPNVINIYHLGEHEGRKYLTMRWIEGTTLARTLQRRAPLDESTTLELATRLASALEAAHGRGVLHRDIKPQNILLDDEGTPFITDFGLARLVGDSGMTSHGVFVGTPDYASPEQIRSRPLDARSDLYALGVVLYEMVTGRRPFAAESTRAVLDRHLHEEPAAPETLNPAISSGLSAVIRRCLEKKPADRFQSAAELRQALERMAR